VGIGSLAVARDAPQRSAQQRARGIDPVRRDPAAVVQGGREAMGTGAASGRRSAEHDVPLRAARARVQRLACRAGTSGELTLADHPGGARGLDVGDLLKRPGGGQQGRTGHRRATVLGGAVAGRARGAAAHRRDPRRRGSTQPLAAAAAWDRGAGVRSVHRPREPRAAAERAAPHGDPAVGVHRAARLERRDAAS
jgi:hypothetical protein